MQMRFKNWPYGQIIAGAFFKVRDISGSRRSVFCGLYCTSLTSDLSVVEGWRFLWGLLDFLVDLHPLPSPPSPSPALLLSLSPSPSLGLLFSEPLELVMEHWRPQG